MDDEVAALIADLAAPERARRLAAIYRLGEALAGRGAADGAREAIAALEAIVADREAGAWLRKRAKRALAKIRGA